MSKKPVIRTRVEFDFTGEALTALDDMKRELEAPTRAETVRRALALLDHVLQARKKGESPTISDLLGDDQVAELLGFEVDSPSVDEILGLDNREE